MQPTTKPEPAAQATKQEPAIKGEPADEPEPTMRELVATVVMGLAEDARDGEHVRAKYLGVMRCRNGEPAVVCTCGGWQYVRRLKKGARCGSCQRPWGLRYFSYGEAAGRSIISSRPTPRTSGGQFLDTT